MTREGLAALSKSELVELCLAQQETISRLEALVATQQATIQRLEARVTELEQRLGQNSRNSHRPPSSDGYRKPSSPARREQKAAGRRPGGQPGHEGTTLAMAAKPEHTKELWPQTCPGCGAALSGEGRLAVRGQVHDLPPVRLEVTEWRAMERVCSGCGEVCRALLPEGVVPGAQYGSRMKALIVYLSVQHLTPWERTTQILRDIVGAAVSEGTLASALVRCGEGVNEVVGAIKHGIRGAAVAHFDETGARVDGRLRWLHTAGTEQLTHYAIDAKRGREAHERIGILPTFQGVAVHDGYESYKGYGCLHQLCNAHHLRELAAVCDTTGQVWAKEMADLLRKILHDRKEAGSLTTPEQEAFRSRYEELVRSGRRANLFDVRHVSISKNGRLKRTPAQNLLLRLAQHQEDVLRFMTDPAVPFDNNLAERDLRMMKVKQKVSGCFRTEEGARVFCDIRSYVSTVRKQGGDVLEALTAVFNGQPLMLQPVGPPE